MLMLNKKFAVDKDNYNFILKEMVTGKPDSNGVKKESWATRGYYSTFLFLIQGMINMTVLDKLGELEKQKELFEETEKKLLELANKIEIK